MIREYVVIVQSKYFHLINLIFIYLLNYIKDFS